MLGLVLFGLVVFGGVGALYAVRRGRKIDIEEMDDEMGDHWVGDQVFSDLPVSYQKPTLMVVPPYVAPPKETPRKRREDDDYTTSTAVLGVIEAAIDIANSTDFGSSSDTSSGSDFSGGGGDFGGGGASGDF